MATKSCKVTVRDTEGVEHTVHVTASTLYEAVALGIASLHGEEWVAGIATGSNEVKVTVVNVPVEHSVKLKDFTNWLERPVRCPKDVCDRHRVREVLGITEEDQRAGRYRGRDRH